MTPLWKWWIWWNRAMFFCKNWKLCIHLLLRTRHFGVNGKLWEKNSGYSSVFGGWPWYRSLWAIITVRPLLRNYRSIIWRVSIGFVSQETARSLGWDDETLNREWEKRLEKRRRRKVALKGSSV